MPIELPELEPTITYAEASGERLAAVVRELQATHGTEVNYDSLSVQEKARYEEAVYNEYANHLVANVFPNVQEVTAFSQLRLRDVLTQYTQYLREEMTKRGNSKAGTPENQVAIASDQERVVQEHNRNLFEADLPTKIVIQSADVTTGSVTKQSALQNLIQIGQ